MKLSPVGLDFLASVLPDLPAHDLVVRIHDRVRSCLAVVLAKTVEPTTSVNSTVTVVVSVMARTPT